MSKVGVKDVAIDKYNLPVMTINLKHNSIVSIPTQIGCAIGCEFCLSSQSKFERNLKPEEIVTLAEAGLLDAYNKVCMSYTGEGEPILNMKNINQSFEILQDNEQVDHFRVCTSGIKAEKLGDIAQLNKPINLQFSMHSPFNDIRRTLIKNTKNLPDILEQLEKYKKRFGEVAINYVLMRGVNDSREDLKELMRIIPKDYIIKLNPLLDNSKFKSSDQGKMFEEVLLENGFQAKRFNQIGSTIRNSLYDYLTYNK